ncbi:MAG: hypothetical protein KGH72_02890 [Candidatus Micrarchaeota archaeon]|nr:hypothetical protein [Candidatus Micrarchaeota archaeon]
MTLDAIRKSIIDDAHAKAAKAESEASKEADRIIAEAEQKAKAILKKANEDADSDAERVGMEMKASSETESNSMLLEAKAQAVEHSLDDVMKLADSELTKSGMERILKAGMKQFAEISGSSDMIVKTSKKNAGLLKNAKNVEYEDIDGFLFSTGDGKVVLNATVGSISQREADAARKLVAEELFGARQRERARVAPVKVAARKRKTARKGKKRG